MMNVYAELKVDPAQIGNTYEDIKTYVNQTWYKQDNQTDTSNSEKSKSVTPDIEGEHIVSDESQSNGTRMLYMNQIPFQVGTSVYSVVYILEMRNVEHETRQLFYLKPEISFLRMLLDYFFKDFFANSSDTIKINKDDTITRKYNEDGIQFNRRLTRLFFGKMQNYLQNNTKFDDFEAEFDNELRNEYYVNSLLEKMDDISCLTYENASPFGSILFMNKAGIAQQSIIRFTITFTKEDRIRLEDAKRIRKLLELTNVDKDLYLIADENEIYGLGEVNWNVLKGSLALRLDFTGLSKYNFVLVRTEAEPMNGGKLFVEDEKKYYRSDLSLIETKLVSVNFKNPRLGEDGYSSEKFTHLLKNIFWEDHADYDQVKHKIEKLDHIVRKAREQKHGTMVVITEQLTANKELSSLSKQSTLIEPGIINPEYIKFLTAIDGAIYFDTDGNCHAIGVILDGIAKEDIGDASRGARYNSAHRYLHKLKDDKHKKCVIVIISEDGMVDLIPESEHEDMLLALADDIIDMINEEAPDAVKLMEMENILLNSKIVDCDWLFNIGDVYYGNKNFERAIDFFEYGIERAEKSYILPQYYNQLGNCYHNNKEHYENAIKMYERAIEGEDSDRSKQHYLGNIGNSYLMLALNLKKNSKEFEKELIDAIDWLSQGIALEKTRVLKPLKRNYSTRGRCYVELSDIEKSRDKDKKNLLLNQSIEDYSQAIMIDPNNASYYWSRFCSYDRLSQVKESIENLIQAEYITHNDTYIDNLSQLLKKQPDLITESVEYYKKIAGQKEGPPVLVELLTQYMAKAEANKQAEAAAGKAPDIDESKKK
ncbi:tetratricopeptide repeat protein [Paenibacillus alba]|uniref:Tetratricopeptide repeat protein n=1 Tax=Paenibacillus alba TaxID=1197127 RepID=A0ABU6FXT6_9BACL|nr:tetratricopeptide repeat protein [Paenibacillus alba]MEC0226729.1 tetratricopeptide repeat protein [Paenibacillus alba]